MTGFGRARASRNGYTVQVDLRSFNGRFLEIRVRGLADLPYLAARCEERVQAAFTRGTLEVYVRWMYQGEHRPRRAQLPTARRYLAELRELQQKLDLPGCPGLDHLLQLGVFQEDMAEEELLRGALDEALDQAILEVHSERTREGQQLQAAVGKEVQALQMLLEEAERLVPEALHAAEERLRKRLAELGVEADPARVAAELVLWAERTDVREELDRIRSHLRRLQELLGSEAPVGKELEFLAQELGREASTLGAKARSAQLARVALETRLVVERIREQVRNVE